MQHVTPIYVAVILAAAILIQSEAKRKCFNQIKLTFSVLCKQLWLDCRRDATQFTVRRTAINLMFISKIYLLETRKNQSKLNVLRSAIENALKCKFYCAFYHRFRMIFGFRLFSMQQIFQCSIDIQLTESRRPTMQFINSLSSRIYVSHRWMCCWFHTFHLSSHPKSISLQQKQCNWHKMKTSQMMQLHISRLIFIYRLDKIPGSQSKCIEYVLKWKCCAFIRVPETQQKNKTKRKNALTMHKIKCIWFYCVNRLVKLYRIE